MRRPGPIAASLLALCSAVYGQVDTKCQNSVCYGLNIPASTASSGTGDIFIQIKAPTSMAWAGVGQGSSMSGSDIFIIYTDASGTNVTVSPRLGTGDSEPKFNSDAKITLLDGTGVSGGNMVANFKCSSCNSWSGGSANFKGSAGSWIFAYKGGSAINSDSTSASLSQHDNMGTFSFDYSKANGGSSANPLVASSSSSGSGSGSSSTSGGSCAAKNGGSSGSASGSATATATSGSSSGGSGGSGTSSGSGGSSTATGSAHGPWDSFWGNRWPSATATPTSNPSRFKRDDTDDCSDSGSSISSLGSSSFFSGNRSTIFIMAHGILASVCFVILLPIGSIIIRLLSFPGLIWLHATMQIVGYLMYIIAFGLGIYIAQNLHAIDKYHAVIGIVIFVLIFFQPILGMMHHRLYKRYQARTFYSYAHVWLGRSLITLGIINGGLGLKYANNTKNGEIAYGVVAAIIWLFYVIAAIVGELKRRKAVKSNPPKYTESSPDRQPTRQSRRRTPAPSEAGNHEYYSGEEWPRPR